MDADKITQALRQPFDPASVHWRVGATNREKTKGIALAYIDARDVMRRLDEVCGAYWQDEYPFEGCCRIGIKIGDEWLWRSNGAGETDVEGEKGRYSDAFKRAAVLWGVGRYLYDLPNVWVPIKQQGRSYALAQTPNLPSWAIPAPAAISSEQVSQVKQAAEMAGAETGALLAYYKVRDFSELTTPAFNDAMAKLKRKAQENAA